MLKLACVNCGAPLEIGPDLDVFACGYCGSQQRVERKGGVIALRRVEAAIKAVQRGTDRTAAELAMPRLQKELSELQIERKLAVAATKERYDGAVRGRTYLTIAVFFGMFAGGSLFIAAANSTALSTFWLMACVAASVYVYRRTKLPADRSSKVAAEMDEKIRRVTAHIDANRKILDELPG